MPVHKIQCGYQYGQTGKKYYGKDAKKKAKLQELAIRLSGYKEDDEKKKRHYLKHESDSESIGRDFVSEFFNDDQLEHHGVIGMHWGIRRYQPYPSAYRGDGKFVGKILHPRNLVARNDFKKMKQYPMVIIGEIHNRDMIKYYDKLLTEKKPEYFICEFADTDRCYTRKQLKDRMDHATDGAVGGVGADYQYNYWAYELAYKHGCKLIGCNTGDYKNTGRMHDEDAVREKYMLDVLKEFQGKNAVVQLGDHHLRSIPITQDFLDYTGDTEDDRGIVSDLTVDNASPVWEYFANRRDTCIARVDDEYKTELAYIHKKGDNFLQHHGILGQKWGIRRFQPYPKGYHGDGKFTGKNFGYRDIETPMTKKRLKTERVKNRTSKDNKMIKEIQAWEDNERKHILRGKQIVHSAKIMGFKVKRMFDDVDAKNGLPRIKRIESADDALKTVNPSKGSHLASSNNCCLCTIAYDMRRRGYDVIAKQNAPINLLYDVGPEDVSWMYGFPKEVSTKTADGLQRALEKQPKGSRGACFCSWREGTGGHVIAYEIGSNGKPMFYDAQSGDKYTKASDIFDGVKATSFMRLDDKEPNYNFVKIAVQ